MLISFIFVCVVGTLFHFVYEWSNHNKIVALFAAVNESTWEHIKICLTPTFIYSLVDGYLYGMQGNYFIAKFFSLLSIIVVMPLIFYSYTSITKRSILPIDIISFYIVVFISQFIFYKVVNLSNFGYLPNYLGLIGIFIIFGTYMVGTLLPVKNFLFKDPISKKYGIKGHTEMDHH